LCWFPLALFIGDTWEVESLGYLVEPFEVHLPPHSYNQWFPFAFFLGLAHLGITLYGLFVNVTARQALFLSRICGSMPILIVVVFLLYWGEEPVLVTFMYMMVSWVIFALPADIFAMKWNLLKLDSKA
jgi:hypothetical protein